jgi:hypothetical protein
VNKAVSLPELSALLGLLYGGSIGLFFFEEQLLTICTSAHLGFSFYLPFIISMGKSYFTFNNMAHCHTTTKTSDVD